MEKKFKFIDLFCGLGGFHVALSRLGGTCVFASDIDPNCRQVYKDNFGLEPHGDITKVNEKDIPAHDVLCAGFPCQAFSKAGKREGMTDPRGTLFFDIIRIVQLHKPAYLMLENVRNLVGHDEGNTWRVVKEHLHALGYVFPDEPIIFSPHLLGIPQFRERVFILCQRKDVARRNLQIKTPLTKPECHAEQILLESDSKTPDISRYTLSGKELEVLDLWNEFIQGIKAPLPTFPVWTEEFAAGKRRVSLDNLPAWKRNIILHNRALYEKNKVFIDAWLKKCAKCDVFTGSKAKLEWQSGENAKPDMWENILQFRPSGVRVKRPTYFPALVAITQTSIVGKLRRRLTPRETARLQSFPDTYKLHPNDRIAYRQLGNSVNVEVVRFFAQQLLKRVA
ncbi:MAG: DNA cytosine methyltransferase [Prevotellaceae bacterium]|jgi:DNA (cytosine-5)-methyltransferase 1|nr:DNA cytosine methyltransferase [Prevotellaceae bacterium]